MGIELFWAGGWMNRQRKREKTERQIDFPRAKCFALCLVIYEKSSREWIAEVMASWQKHVCA